MVHVDHGAVGDDRRHGVALYPHGQLRAGRYVAGDRYQLIVLAEHRRGKARGGGGRVQRDDPPLGGGCGGAQVVSHFGQRVHQRVDGLAPGQGQIPVFGQQTALLVTVAAGDGAVAAPVQIVGLSLQRVKQPQEHLLLGGADARLVVAHGGYGHSQSVGQRLPGQPQLLPPPPHLLTKRHAAHLLDKYRLLLTVYYAGFLVLSRDNHKKLVIFDLTSQVSCDTVASSTSFLVLKGGCHKNAVAWRRWIQTAAEGAAKNEKSTPERALLRRAGPLLSGRAHDRYRGVDNKNTDRLKG